MRRIAPITVVLCLTAVAHAGSLFQVDRAGQRIEVQEGVRLVRHYAYGAPDRSFGTGGNVPLLDGPAGLAPKALALDAQARILVAGTVHDGVRPAAAVMRLSPQGASDTAWGHEGIARQHPAGVHHALADVLPLASGEVMVLGAVGEGASVRPALWRLDARGGLDARFDLLVWQGPTARPLALAVMGSTKLVVAVEVAAAGGWEAQLHTVPLHNPQAAPELLARQVLPRGDFQMPVPKLDGRRWVWVEGAADTGEMALVKFVAADQARSPWGRQSSAAPAAASAAMPTASSAADHDEAGYNPFALRASEPTGSASTAAPVPGESPAIDEPLVLGGVAVVAFSLAALWGVRRARRPARV